MPRRFRIILMFALVSFGHASHASESYACRTTGELLTDLDVLQAAMDYELREHGLPKHIHDLGAAGLKERAPDCCFVERETSDWNANRGWSDRLLSLPVIDVSIHWERIDKTSPVRHSSYLVALCGNILDRSGATRN